MLKPHPESYSPRIFYTVWMPTTETWVGQAPNPQTLRTFELLKTGEAVDWKENFLDPDKLGRFWVIKVDGQNAVNFLRPAADYFTPQPSDEAKAALAELEAQGLKVGDDGNIISTTAN